MFSGDDIDKKETSVDDKETKEDENKVQTPETDKPRKRKPKKDNWNFFFSTLYLNNSKNLIHFFVKSINLRLKCKISTKKIKTEG